MPSPAWFQFALEQVWKSPPVCPRRQILLLEGIWPLGGCCCPCDCLDTSQFQPSTFAGQWGAANLLQPAHLIFSLVPNLDFLQMCTKHEPIIKLHRIQGLTISLCEISTLQRCEGCFMPSHKGPAVMLRACLRQSTVQHYIHSLLLVLLELKNNPLAQKQNQSISAMMS